MAVSSLPADGVQGPTVAALVPLAVIDELATALTGTTGSVTVTLDDPEVSFALPDSNISGRRLDLDFPDFRRLLPAGERRQVRIEATTLRDLIARAGTRTMTRESDGIEYQVSVLAVDETGAVAVVDPAHPGAAPTDTELVGVNRDFLLQALAAGRGGQLSLELDGPIAPLAIRNADAQGAFSILMPVRLDAV